MAANPKTLRIVYMGTPDFAVAPLKALVEGGYHIVAVVTMPDKPAGRGLKLQESAVKRYAVSAGLLHVGRQHALHDFRMGPLGVVAVE